MDANYSDCGAEDVPHIADVMQTVFLISVMMMITLGNLLNIAVIQKTKRVLVIPRYFMTSLAITDLGVGLLCIPFGIRPTIVGFWIYGDVWCQLVGCLSCTFAALSTYTLLLVGIERYIAVKWPLHYPLVFTNKRAIWMILSIWFTVIVFCFSLIDFYSDLPLYIYLKDYYICAANLYNPNKRAFVMATIAVVVVIPSLIMVYVYSTLARVAWQHSKRIKLSYKQDSKTGDNNKVKSITVDNWKAARMFIAVACAFMLAWFPFSITVLYRVLSENDIPPLVSFCTYWLVALNSFWNFLVYGVMSRNYRDTAKGILRELITCNGKCSNSTEVKPFELSDNLRQVIN